VETIGWDGAELKLNDTVRVQPLAAPDQVALATFDADPTFSQNASPGFIELFSLQSRMAHQISEARKRG
jgi:hypothetical protein